jgi:RES domain-containing protein
MVYTSTSRALAALEFFVNLDPIEAPDNLLMAEATVPEASVETIKLDVLPRNWRGLDNKRCRDVGSEWARSLRSVALKVPSVVVDGDWNVLLNPKHPEFGKVKIGVTKPFRFDERMFS